MFFTDDYFTISQVWSVRSCEGSLKKRGHCLLVNGLDARALIAPVSICGKLSVRRTPPDQLVNQTQPRAVMRVANRVNNRNHQNSHHAAHDLEPFLQDLQNDVARLSRAFATLGYEADALVRSEAEMRARIEYRRNPGASEPTGPSADVETPPTVQNNEENTTENVTISRNARRRMRQRLRAALNEDESPPLVPAPRAMTQQALTPQRQNGPTNRTGFVQIQPPASAPSVPPQPIPPPSSSSGPSNELPQNGNGRVSKKKRRHRR